MVVRATTPLEFPSVTPAHALLSADERAAIAEIEATTSILQLVTRLTGMRFAGIAKFTDLEWVVCSVHDTLDMGIHVDDVLDLETTLCSEFCINPQTLFIPQVSQDGRFAVRPVVKRYAIERYAGAPIFLPDGRLFGALCALDSRAMLFDAPNLAETLSLFARLIGCMFFANLTAADQ
ncbi:GAF domain-containing protein [Pseudomonas sp. MWU15-20650]|uniref:GAF domain-containing protein n=1 Tax=Pseudomonas sp. MWU15-20650 TaxID=2933107 RepID=UPI00200C5021